MTLPDAVLRRLDTLARATPEWRSWVVLAQETLRSAADSGWDSIEWTLAADRDPAAPLLAGAEVSVDLRLGREWVARLFEVASRAGGRRTSFLRVALDRADSGRFLEAAIGQDLPAAAGACPVAGIEPGTLAALAGLASAPILQACGRQLAARVPDDWSRGYCPVCGAWPTLAEVRGIEREVRLRCSRCGGEWRADWLRCPYCGNTDHERLGSLIPDTGGESRKVETCHACNGYLKTLATLRPWSPAEVVLQDLETVDLDLAALERGYRRPERPAFAVAVRLVDRPGGPVGRVRRLLGRRA